MFQNRSHQHSDSLKQEIKILYYFLFSLIILGVLKFPIELNFAIQELLACLILYCGLQQKNSCLLVFFVIQECFFIIQYFLQIGMRIQIFILLKTSFFENNFDKFTFTVFVLSLLMNLLTIYRVSKAYRLIKQKNHQRITYSPTNERQRLNEDIEIENDFKAFQGKGMRIG